MRLTKNFTLEELCHSATAQRLGLVNWCEPGSDECDNLLTLCTDVVQIVRDRYGPTIISSGYRILELNRRLGSSDNSKHITGQAADIIVPGVDHRDVFRWMKIKLPYHKLILEHCYSTDEQGWIHVSHISDAANATETYLAVSEDGKTVYRPYTYGKIGDEL